MTTAHRRWLPPFLILIALAPGAPAAAQDRLCDPGGEDCRSILLDYIRNERAGIDVAFWFMEDPRYTAELIRRHQAGVPVRVLMDTRANSSYPLNASRLRELQDAGIPMRRRLTGYILHWKMMLFHGQNVVQFSGANYSGEAWVPLSSTPYANYVDEAIYFTSDTAIVNSFRTRFDDEWIDTEDWTAYANVPAQLTRRYGLHPKDPSLNFPPEENFRNRSIALYRTEPGGIDVTMYRITDRRHTDDILSARARGVPVRLITEPQQYRDRSRLWHSWNVDRLYMGGVQIRNRSHSGLNHQKSVILQGQQTVIFGSSNWTSPSAAGQLEHNLFTTKPHIVSWFVSQFERKWNNATGVAETAPFVPLPPDRPSAPSPSNLATGISPNVTLSWYGGPWAHLYDVYLGTTPADTALIASNLDLGPSEHSRDVQRYTIPGGLRPNTTYYWHVVGKTMALRAQSSPVWSFTTGLLQAPAAPTLVSPIGVSSSANPRFVWNAVGTATHYYLWISDRTGRRFARWYERSAVSCGSGTGTCSMTTSVPLHSGTIWWWVQAWNVDGYGPWSAAGTYTLQPLSAPALIAPSWVLPNWPSIEFQWQAAPGATHHYLWVTDGAGIVRVRTWYDRAATGCTSGGTCRVTLRPPLSPGVATWWVQAWNATAGYSAWSVGNRIVPP